MIRTIRPIVEGITALTEDPISDLEDALRAFAGGDVERWLDACTDDVEFAFPFAPAGRPRLLRGRTEVGGYLRSVLAAASARTVRSLTVLRTDDPDVVVIELTVRARHPDPAGSSVVRDTSSIAVVGLREGRVSSYRDYWNPQGGRIVTEADA